MHNLFLFIVTMGMFVLPLVSIAICEKLRKEAFNSQIDIMIHQRGPISRSR